MTATLQSERLELRLLAGAPGRPPVPVALEAPADAEPETATRTAVFDGDEHEARVLRGELPAGTEVDGPAICELPEATLVVPPGWSGDVHPTGTVRLSWTR